MLERREHAGSVKKLPPAVWLFLKAALWVVWAGCALTLGWWSVAFIVLAFGWDQAARRLWSEHVLTVVLGLLVIAWAA